MTTDFRALCAELLRALENEGYAHWAITPDVDPLCLRARAALDQPAPAVVPVPVSERLPRPEECTWQGWCWVLYRNYLTWTLEPPLGQDGRHTGYTHWLPHWALPVPTPANNTREGQP